MPAFNFSDLGGKAVQQATPPAPGQTFDFSDMGGKVVQAAQGQVRNDVGNTVIVPKEGESFADTMKRAAAYGKTVTPEQINAETATAPTKAAETLVAAPLIGAAGTAGLAGAGATAPPTLKALAPIAQKYGIKALEGAGLGLGWHLYNELKKVFEGPGQ